MPNAKCSLSYLLVFFRVCGEATDQKILCAVQKLPRAGHKTWVWAGKLGILLQLSDMELGVLAIWGR